VYFDTLGFVFHFGSVAFLYNRWPFICWIIIR